MVEDVVVSLVVVIIIFVVGEVVFYWVDREFFFKFVDFVEEENDWGFDELFGVVDGVEECESFLYVVDCFIFK